MANFVKILICIIVALIFNSAERLDGGFREVALQLHNEYRQQYNISPLRLNSELNRIAHIHAEELARTNKFSTSGPAGGFGEKQNLWAHLGELRPLALDTRDAVNCWYSGSKPPGNTVELVTPDTLYSNDVRFLGIGVGTNETYTVVVGTYI